MFCSIVQFWTKQWTPYLLPWNLEGKRTHVWYAPMDLKGLLISESGIENSCLRQDSNILVTQILYQASNQQSRKLVIIYWYFNIAKHDEESRLYFYDNPRMSPTKNMPKLQRAWSLSKTQIFLLNRRDKIPKKHSNQRNTRKENLATELRKHHDQTTKITRLRRSTCST